MNNVPIQELTPGKWEHLFPKIYLIDYGYKVMVDQMGFPLGRKEVEKIMATHLARNDLELLGLREQHRLGLEEQAEVRKQQSDAQRAAKKAEREAKKRLGHGK